LIRIAVGFGRLGGRPANSVLGCYSPTTRLLYGCLANAKPDYWEVVARISKKNDAWWEGKVSGCLLTAINRTLFMAGIMLINEANANYTNSFFNYGGAIQICNKCLISILNFKR
jgi:hypothetical protein